MLYKHKRHGQNMDRGLADLSSRRPRCSLQSLKQATRKIRRPEPEIIVSSGRLKKGDVEKCAVEGMNIHEHKREQVHDVQG